MLKLNNIKFCSFRPPPPNLSPSPSLSLFSFPLSLRLSLYRFTLTISRPFTRIMFAFSMNKLRHSISHALYPDTVYVPMETYMSNNHALSRSLKLSAEGHSQNELLKEKSCPESQLCMQIKPITEMKTSKIPGRKMVTECNLRTNGFMRVEKLTRKKQHTISVALSGYARAIHALHCSF